MSSRLKPLTAKEREADTTAREAYMEAYKLTKGEACKILSPRGLGVITKEAIAILRESWLIGSTDLEAIHNACITNIMLRDFLLACPEASELRDILKSNVVYTARKRMYDLINDEDPKVAFGASKYILDKFDGKAKETIEIRTPASLLLEIRKIQEEDLEDE